MNASVISHLNFKAISLDHDEGTKNVGNDERVTKEGVVKDGDSMERVIIKRLREDELLADKVVGEGLLKLRL